MSKKHILNTEAHPAMLNQYHQIFKTIQSYWNEKGWKILSRRGLVCSTSLSRLITVYWWLVCLIDISSCTALCSAATSLQPSSRQGHIFILYRESWHSAPCRPTAVCLQWRWFTIKLQADPKVPHQDSASGAHVSWRDNHPGGSQERGGGGEREAVEGRRGMQATVSWRRRRPPGGDVSFLRRFTPAVLFLQRDSARGNN